MNAPKEHFLIDSLIEIIQNQLTPTPDPEYLFPPDSGRETFLREGRMQVILQAMTSFTDSRQIHQCCCKVLAMVVLIPLVMLNYVLNYNYLILNKVNDLMELLFF